MGFVKGKTTEKKRIRLFSHTKPLLKNRRLFFTAYKVTKNHLLKSL